MAIEIDTLRGVANHYGVRVVNKKFGGDTDDDKIKLAEWTFDFNDLPVAGTNNLQYSIPANARILSAKLEIITAFTSTSTTTDLTVGLATAAGVAIDAAGLVTATEATQTTIAVVGAVITGAGLLVNNTIGAVAGELTVAPSVADLLTGRARVLVQYIKAGV